MFGSLQLREIILPAAIVLVVFFVALLLPPFGVIVGIFSPAPLVILSLTKGRQVGLVTTGLVFMALFVAMGIQHALFFFSEYGRYFTENS